MNTEARKLVSFLQNKNVVTHKNPFEIIEKSSKLTNTQRPFKVLVHLKIFSTPSLHMLKKA